MRQVGLWFGTLQTPSSAPAKLRFSTFNTRSLQMLVQPALCTLYRLKQCCLCCSHTLNIITLSQALCNNAGIFHSTAWKRLLDINLCGLVNIIPHIFTFAISSTLYTGRWVSHTYQTRQATHLNPMPLSHITSVALNCCNSHNACN